jgi:DNA repair exonuclease SbcCD ATPase subunit
MRKEGGMKRIVVGVAVGGAFLAVTAPLLASCDQYAERIRRAERELKQFDRLVVEPLRRQKRRLEAELDRELGGPVRIEEKIRDLQQKNRNAGGKAASHRERISRQEESVRELHSSLDDLDRKIDEAGAGKKAVKKLVKERNRVKERLEELRSRLRRNRRDLDAVEDKIDGRAAKIERLREAREEIISQPPTAAELEEGLAAGREEFQDEKVLRKRKEQEAALFASALELCRDHKELETFHGAYREAVVRLRAYGCGAIERPGRAESQALRDLNCAP